MKTVLYSFVAFVILIALIIGLTFFDLGFKRYFKPKYQNVEREVFENTKSFSHGMIQDLAKHYGEYNEAGPDGKAIITNIIKVNYADFDGDKITNYQLRQFLTSTRGY